jgi:phage shock protein PspC (stress-responsive transcriptional regulator)
LGGVATGIANYFDVTPIVVQIAFVASTAIGGFGALAYIACWFLIPKVSDPETRPVTITSDTTRAVLGALFAVAAASSSLTFGQGTFEITLIPLILIAAGFYLLNQRASEGLPTPPTEPGIPTDQPAASEFASEQRHWADVDTSTQPAVPSPPSPPVTSVTLATAAVVVGLLLTINQFGPSISAVAIFGAALAVVGGGLVYGAFRGRARGLIPVGLLLMLGLALSPAFDALAEGGTGNREFAPLIQSDVRDTYDLGAGPLELDLRGVDFEQDQTISVTVGAGYAEIWLPNDVNVEIDAETSAGYVDLFGRENAGIFTEGTASRSARVDESESAADRPTITIDADVTFGYVEVRRG